METREIQFCCGAILIEDFGAEAYGDEPSQHRKNDVKKYIAQKINVKYNNRNLFMIIFNQYQKMYYEDVIKELGFTEVSSA